MLAIVVETVVREVESDVCEGRVHAMAAVIRFASSRRRASDSGDRPF
jgi:hypothetical protein